MTICVKQKAKKYKKSVLVLYFYIEEKKQVENISPLNTTISMAPGISILVEKLKNITFGGFKYVMFRSVGTLLVWLIYYFLYLYQKPKTPYGAFRKDSQG